jgi:hypothetical protein
MGYPHGSAVASVIAEAGRAPVRRSAEIARGRRPEPVWLVDAGHGQPELSPWDEDCLIFVSYMTRGLRPYMSLLVP